MIYDSLKHLELYKGLSDDIYEGLKFLQKVDADMPEGVYHINPRVKAIVSEYETKRQNENGYEAHRANIDIQYLISGSEKIACLPVEKLVETKPYSDETDAAFYSSDTDILPQEMLIGSDYFAIFYPQDGHMPQLCITTPTPVKKVVVKVQVY
jgi:YhcH/YjgK/YiaL family protein